MNNVLPPDDDTKIVKFLLTENLALTLHSLHCTTSHFKEGAGFVPVPMHGFCSVCLRL